MTLLESRKVSKHFGGLKALDEVDADIHQGEIFGLIGPNGSGKTTWFNLVTGFLRPTAGDVLYNGESIVGLKPHQIAAKGVIRTFQISSLFADLTAIENVIASSYLKLQGDFWGSLFYTRTYREERTKSRKRAMKILGSVGLGERADVLAKNLPYGDFKVLEIASALAAEPELLLLDEPVTGMNREEIARVADLIRGINQNGTTIIIVEHNVHVVMELCSRIAVLNFGAKIAEGTPEEIRMNEKVISVYLGESGKIA